MGVCQGIDAREIHVRVIDGLQLVVQGLRLCEKGGRVRQIGQRGIRPPVIALLVRQLDGLRLVLDQRVLIQNRILPRAERLQFFSRYQPHRAHGRLGRI